MNEMMYKILREKPEEIPLTTSVHVNPPGIGNNTNFCL
jgi:hypothetical protein